MLKKAAAVFLIGASLSIWVGCGSTSNHYVYAAIPAASQIVAYREDPNSGILTALVGSPFTAGPSVQSIVIHPSKKFLYAANSGGSSGTVSQFLIASDGTLTEQTPRTVVGTVPTLLAMDSAGAFLYVANSGSLDISVFSIDAGTGTLSAVAGSPFSIGISALNMRLSPSGNVLYVTGSAGGGLPGFIQAFSINAGVLSIVPGSPFQTGMTPQGLTIDSAGTFLYTANAAPDNSISIFTINADGSLTELSGSPVGETFIGPIALLLDNSGKYLYVANEGSNNLSAYAVGSDGGLTVLSNSPFAAAPEPSYISSDPSGKFLFVGNQSGPVIQPFSLDSTGTLTSVATYSVSGTPTSIVVMQ
ncbi:MAG TPA: beta-propeller fold lactonase family protein [Candidatus Sulfotelmatobacter sp.]|jgi:6-phosphogluconolactonase (cycloisomerase 2 family)|nr:beta-propeller fold lactonase family protein [Candidatus Sulfotelmatobacter sp.]